MFVEICIKVVESAEGLCRLMQSQVQVHADDGVIYIRLCGTGRVRTWERGISFHACYKLIHQWRSLP